MSYLSRAMRFDDVRLFFRVTVYFVLRLVITPTLYLSSAIICCDVAVVLLFVSCFCGHMKRKCTSELYSNDTKMIQNGFQNDTKWFPKWYKMAPKGCQLEDLKILYILSPILTWFVCKSKFGKSPGAPFKTNDCPKTVPKFQYGHFLAPRYRSRGQNVDIGKSLGNGNKNTKIWMKN